MKVSIYASVRVHDSQPLERVRVSLTEKPAGNWWKCENPNNPQEWFIAPLEHLKNIEPVFELTDQASDLNGRTVEHLVYKVLFNFALDPARVLRAVSILNNPALIEDKGNFYLIKSDETKPAYIVTRGHCTCKDSEKGNICKHRIAAFFKRMQSAPRPRYFEFNYCLLCDFAHWLEDGETCNGKDFDPRLSIKNATFKMRNTTSTTKPASIDVYIKVNA